MTLAAIVVASCGDDGGAGRESGTPVGERVLPNLVPAAPTIIQMQKVEGGDWELRFTSVLVNVGEGDFELSGSRVGDDWLVEQQLEYSRSGVEPVSTDAELAWGGDGHEHWHVKRVATYRLEPIDASGASITNGVGREDTKVGFCFFDSNKVLDRGPGEPGYGRHGCGDEDSTSLEMGLSPGWGDTYIFSLPGQSIDVSDLPDGRYRLWAEADERGWFVETTRDDNLTWADIELGTRGDVRTALVVDRGPEPE